MRTVRESYVSFNPKPGGSHTAHRAFTSDALGPWFRAVFSDGVRSFKRHEKSSDAIPVGRQLMSTSLSASGPSESGKRRHVMMVPRQVSRLFDGLAFSRWVPWNDHEVIKDADSPGVYLLARFPTGVPRSANPLDPRVLYIGQTVAQTLSKRWYQFGRSAFERKPAHSGGWTFGDRIARTPRGLYVSAMPVRRKEPYSGARIRALEQALIWAYVGRHGRRPKCNLQ